MATDDGDAVREVGSRRVGPSRGVPGGLMAAMVALGAGLAIGVLIGSPEPTVDETTGPTLPTTAVTAPAPGETTTTIGSSLSLDDYEKRIDELETELAEARQQVFELGLEVNPAEFAVALGCHDSIGSQYPVDWQTNSLFVGPVAFYQLTQRLPVPGWAEVFAVVEASDSVTLLVPESERDSYSLIWNPEIWRTVDGDYTVGDGDPAVTLRSCDGSASVFIGGFVSNRSYCAPLAVYFGDSMEPHQVGLPFGDAPCPDEVDGFATAQSGPVPDVTGLPLREARLAIRLAGLDPVVNDGESDMPDSLVWAQEPDDGQTHAAGSVVGLRTCQSADPTIAAFQQRLDSMPGQDHPVLSHGWMTPASDPGLEEWHFVSALITGGPSDGQIATWVLPPWIAPDDPLNTPGIAFFLNETAQNLGFGDSRFNPQAYGGETWTDFAGALESQRCVEMTRTQS